MSLLTYDIVWQLCHMLTMTYDIYDIHNIWWFGCPENRQNLSYSAPGFKATQKVNFIPKNEKWKKWKLPLYFKIFPLWCHVYKEVQIWKGCTHLNGNFLVWLQFICVSHIQYFLAKRNKQLFNFMARLTILDWCVICMD